MQIRFALVAALLAFGGAVSAQDATKVYTLDSCPVSGDKLGDDAVVKEISGREVRFCGEECAKDFAESAADWFEEIDARMAAAQRRYYTLKTCPVSGEPLDADSAEEAMIGNRLVLLCCGKCKGGVAAKQADILKKLDAAAVEAQAKAYPLKTCPVSGGELGKMGEPYQTVLAGRVVKLCCKDCLPKLLKNPGKFLATIDAAWKKAGFPGAMKGDDDDHDVMGDDDDMGDHDMGDDDDDDDRGGDDDRDDD